MNENPHSRAQQLIAQSLVEGLNAADQSWLETHLRECPDCSREAARTGELVRAFRSVPTTAPHDLVARTQMRVRLRAQEWAQSSNDSALLWVVTGASWLLGVFSAPLVWRALTWAGALLDLPKPVLELGFVLWWTVPPLVAVAIVLSQRAVTRGFVARGANRDVPVR